MEDNREYYQYAMELLVEESLTVGTILVVIICMQEFVNGGDFFLFHFWLYEEELVVFI